MIKRLARWLLSDEIESLEDEVKSLREDNCILRKESEGMADIKLKLKLALMYADDDEAIDQLLAAKKEQESSIRSGYEYQDLARLQRLSGMGMAQDNYHRNSQTMQGMQGVSILAGIGQQGGRWI